MKLLNLSILGILVDSELASSSKIIDSNGRIVTTRVRRTHASTEGSKSIFLTALSLREIFNDFSVSPHSTKVANLLKEKWAAITLKWFKRHLLVGHFKYKQDHRLDANGDPIEMEDTCFWSESPVEMTISKLNYCSHEEGLTNLCNACQVSEILPYLNPV